LERFSDEEASPLVSGAFFVLTPIDDARLNSEGLQQALISSMIEIPRAADWPAFRLRVD
jgi:hypothetical protein